MGLITSKSEARKIEEARKVEEFRLSLVEKFAERCNWSDVMYEIYSNDIKRIRESLKEDSNYTAYLSKTSKLGLYSNEAEKYNSFVSKYINTKSSSLRLNDPNSPFHVYPIMYEPNTNWIKDRLLFKACMASTRGGDFKDRSNRVLYWLAKNEGKLNAEQLEIYKKLDIVWPEHKFQDDYSILLGKIEHINVPDVSTEIIVEKDKAKEVKLGGFDILGLNISTQLVLAVLIIILLFLIWYLFRDSLYLQSLGEYMPYLSSGTKVNP